ncbi:MAG: hypothetical protein ACJ76H_13225 [Bacteriovoracaceae bacterium]
MIRFVLLFLLSSAAFAADEPGPAQKFLSLIEARQKTFLEFRDKIYKDEVCPSLEYACVLAELKREGLETSADLNNGLSLLSFVLQKKLKKDEYCQDVCHSNLYAEYSVAVLDYLSAFDRKKLFVMQLPPESPETKSLAVNEELRIYKELSRLRENLILFRKKIDPKKIFHADLAKKADNLKSGIENAVPVVLLKGAVLSSLNANDEVLAKLLRDHRDLVTEFREEVK